MLAFPAPILDLRRPAKVIRGSGPRLRSTPGLSTHLIDNVLLLRRAAPLARMRTRASLACDSRQRSKIDSMTAARWSEIRNANECKRAHHEAERLGYRNCKQGRWRRVRGCDLTSHICRFVSVTSLRVPGREIPA